MVQYFKLLFAASPRFFYKRKRKKKEKRKEKKRRLVVQVVGVVGCAYLPSDRWSSMVSVPGLRRLPMINHSSCLKPLAL